jgi:hypothetical protein
MNMTFEKNPIESIKSNNEIISDFESISDPQSLHEFIKKNISYGIVTKAEGKIYSQDSPEWGQGPQPEAIVQSPAELLESRHGTCWEQTELARE